MHPIHWRADRSVSQFVFEMIAFVALVPASVFAREGVRASFALDDSSPGLNEPIFVVFSIHNGLTGVVRVDLGPDRKGNFQFSVSEPDQTPHNLHRAGSKGISFFGICTVAPGETFVQKLLINEWHQFPKPGKYVVQVRFVGSILTEAGTPIAGAVSAILPIEVRAREPERLNAICRELADKAVLPHSGNAPEAGRALSFVNDPVAVPYLSRVLKESFFGKELAIEGLARIGNAEAEETLQSSLEIVDSELRPQIEAALSAIGRRKHSPD